MSAFQAPLRGRLEVLDELFHQYVAKMRSLQSLGVAALAAVSATTANTSTPPPTPHSHLNSTDVLHYVNPQIGTSGTTPNGNGGMIPSVSPPFGMTRWTAQTRENFISQCPYNDLDSHIHGFQATHQPAIWMGESGQVVLVPGVGEVRPLFEERGHVFAKGDERSSAFLYEVEVGVENVLGAGDDLTESFYSPVPGGGQAVPSEVREGANGRTRRDDSAMVDRPSVQPDRHEHHREEAKAKIKVAMTASSHVGHLRFQFPQDQLDEEPYVFLQATRQNWTGSITVDPQAQEVFGSNPQRQDYALGPSRAPGFSGYFVSRFLHPFASYGITHGGALEENATTGTGEHLGAWVRFSPSHSHKTVEVRTGVSFVSIEQARRNLDIEAPPSTTFDDAVETLKEAWLEKLGRVRIEGVNETEAAYDQRTIFYTALFHALQYPADFSEPLETVHGGRRTWYEGYTDRVREDEDSYYQSWSIWVCHHWSACERRSYY